MMYFSTPGMKWATLIGTEMSVDYIKSSASLKSLILVNGLRLPTYNNTSRFISYALCKKETYEPNSYTLNVNRFSISNLKLGNIKT